LKAGFAGPSYLILLIEGRLRRTKQYDLRIIEGRLRRTKQYDLRIIEGPPLAAFQQL
jgi:hypothetical protein